MKYFNLYIILSMFLVSCTPSNEESPEPADVFVKYYGTDVNNVVDLLRVSTMVNGLPEDNFIILASQNDKIFLIRTNEEGNQIGFKLFNAEAGVQYVPSRIKLLPSGELLFVGYMQFNTGGLTTYQGIWCKMDLDFNITSPGGIFKELKQDSALIATDIIQTTETDGVEKVVILGHTQRKLVSTNTAIDYQLYLSKRDYNDSIYWEKLNGFSRNETSLALFENPDKSLMVIGSTSTLTEGENIYFAQLNELGTSDKGSLNVGVEGANILANDIPKKVIKTSAGYSIVGSTNAATNNASVGFHISITQGGSLVDNSSFILDTDYGLASQVFTATRTIDNDLMVLGSIPQFTEGEVTPVSKQEEILLMRVNPLSGHIAGFDQHYGTANGDDQAKAAITLPDGDILVAANIEFGAAITLVGLMRLNKSGELKD
jgi:hypothetical protein